MTDLTAVTLESLEVGAAPLIDHFLQRLQLTALLQRFLPPASTGCPEKLPCALTLTALVRHLLLARQPLYALSDWFARRVPEPLGLLPEHLPCLNDDRFGRLLDRVADAESASLLTAVVLQAVRAFAVELKQLHNDSTTVTLSGAYANQEDPDAPGRPPLLTFGHNKDHRPDLKQLVYCLTVSADGAVPVHVKTYDGNTADDTTHVATWQSLCELVGHADFLYVADCKLCSHDNLAFIAAKNGRFLTVLPRTWQERHWLDEQAEAGTIPWQEVRRQPSRRAKQGPEVVYEGFAYPQRSAQGYRLFWYRSSQKKADEAASRERRLAAFRRWWAGFRGSAKRNRFASEEKAQSKAQELLREKGVADWVVVRVEKVVRQWQQQEGPGRPGPNTKYREGEETYYELRLEEDQAAQAAAAKRDGLFALVSNDESLTVITALGQYKYQPFLEKRFEQLKTVFAVTPVWLKSPQRVASLLLVYFLVLLVQALIEREVRRCMKEKQLKSLPLYPEGRPAKAPTTEQVLAVLEGHRRHRLLGPQGEVLRTFHDPLPPVAQQLLKLLGVDTSAYGIP